MIVDDERLARQVMRKLLASHPDFQIVGEAANLIEAVEAVRRHKPAVLFLDIQMPGGGGFKLLDALAPDPPFVVFVTAYSRHALRAFEVNALDYLLKPVEPERLAEAVQRLRQRMKVTPMPDLKSASLPPLLNEDRVLLPLGNSGCFVLVRDILFVTAQGKRTVVQLRDGRKVIVRQTMASWIERLPAGLFAALDRGCIVQWGNINRADFSNLGVKLTFEAPGVELTLGHVAAKRLRPLIAIR